MQVDPLTAYHLCLVEAIVADRDVAEGCPVTGFELDALELYDRQVAALMEDLVLYGRAYIEQTPHGPRRVSPTAVVL